uniref:RING-type domain-containing protein n=1 Tax=Ficedula albicollis TaxID=59894 RepID=A0A803V8N7_FICAL
HTAGVQQHIKGARDSGNPSAKGRRAALRFISMEKLTDKVPKLLDCQHTFCAVCLKLILRKEENIWIITCPLCRKPTFVSGGLIRTLQDKEDILERLESLDSNPEVYVCAVGLDGNS